jgi:hypothetical protein
VRLNHRLRLGAECRVSALELLTQATAPAGGSNPPAGLRRSRAGCCPRDTRRHNLAHRPPPRHYAQTPLMHPVLSANTQSDRGTQSRVERNTSYLQTYLCNYSRASRYMSASRCRSTPHDRPRCFTADAPRLGATIAIVDLPRRRRCVPAGDPPPRLPVPQGLDDSSLPSRRCAKGCQPDGSLSEAFARSAARGQCQSGVIIAIIDKEIGPSNGQGNRD